MSKSFILAAGIALGGGLMYFFDPQQGLRRRVRFRAQAARALSCESAHVLKAPHTTHPHPELTLEDIELGISRAGQVAEMAG